MYAFYTETGGKTMISYETLLKEMEKHLLQAKSAENTQQLREHLSAIRALCDVGLNQSEELTNLPQNTNPTLSSGKLEEDDANGKSIFDF